MPRRGSTAKKRISSAAGAVGRTAKKLTARLRPSRAAKSAEPAHPRTRPKTAPVAASAPKRKPKTDIPIDLLAGAYSPTQTSLKGPFRTNGADRQRDQEMGRGALDERWNAEDRFTNKSGDPRIGTHGRTYEPGESRLASKRRR